jgi:putative Mg2+ transporter-C (MgtC) family protein
MNTEMGFVDLLLRLTISFLLGGVIGIEREIHGRSAGLRTHMLVALGSALFTILSFEIPKVLGATNSDPTRIAAQVLTGIGFLGAGTILQGRGSVHGLTTAASIWLVAAIGMAVAGGFFRGALLASVLGLVVLVAFYRVEKDMLRRKGFRRIVTAEFMGESEAGWIEQTMVGSSLIVSRWHLSRHDDGLRLRVEGTLEPKQLEKFLETLRRRGSVKEITIEKG